MQFFKSMSVSLGVCAAVAGAGTIHVPKHYPTIQGAIDASTNGDLILIAAGQYSEYNITPLGKAIVIEGATNNQGELVVTVDAGGQGRVFVCDGGETAKTVLKNIIVTGGTAFSGGGIYIENSSPSIVGCRIMNNEAIKGFGGGICVVDGTLSIVDCTFIGNIGGVGGGVYNQPEYGSSHEVQGCLFQDNHAVNGNYGHGGGLNHARGVLNISDCDFIENTASGGGGGMSEFASNGIKMRDCTFIDNIALNGGGLATSGIGGCEIVSSTFIGNYADSYGGGIESGSPILSLTNCRLSENVAGLLGGAVLVLYADQEPAKFVNCMIDNNTTYAGATVSIHGSDETSFVNSAIIDNFGAGLYIYGFGAQSADVHNSVLFGNSNPSLVIEGEVDLDVRYSNIEGGWSGEGNINAEPRFTFVNDMMMIEPDSPCVDIGSNGLLPADDSDIDDDGNLLEPLPIDLVGSARVVGNIVDIGPLEHQPQSCPGDVNGDSAVNVSDILLIINAWGCQECDAADVTDDGIVDVADLLAVVGYWGTCQ